MAWLLTFAKTLLELPLSQLLYAPNLPPISVSVNKLTAYYDFGEGTAMSVIALALAFGVFLLAGSSGFYLRQVGKMLAKV
jgi:iron(III) transport system permease protein